MLSECPGSRNPVMRREKKRDHHGGTNCCTAHTIYRLKRWLDKAGLRDSPEALIIYGMLGTP